MGFSPPLLWEWIGLCHNREFSSDHFYRYVLSLGYL